MTDVFNMMADMFRPQETENLYECKMCHAYYPQLNHGYCDTCWEFEQEDIALKQQDAQDILNEQKARS